MRHDKTCLFIILLYTWVSKEWLHWCSINSNEFRSSNKSDSKDLKIQLEKDETESWKFS